VLAEQTGNLFDRIAAVDFHKAVVGVTLSHVDLSAAYGFTVSDRRAARIWLSCVSMLG
jgi:hypothetical protein